MLRSRAGNGGDARGFGSSVPHSLDQHHRAPGAEVLVRGLEEPALAHVCGYPQRATAALIWSLEGVSFLPRFPVTWTPGALKPTGVLLRLSLWCWLHRPR